MAGKKLIGYIFGVLVCSFITLRASVPIEVISKPYTNIARSFGDSGGILLSADGKWAVFSSNGTQFVTNDLKGFHLEVFLRELETGRITLLSRHLAGTSGDGNSVAQGISGDGRFVLFQSEATDLVENDDNDSEDVFLFDRESDSIHLISQGESEVGDGESVASQITRDGRFIVFESSASNLVPSDSDERPDVFLLNRESGQLELVTMNRDNTAPGISPFVNPFVGLHEPRVSEDGRYVAFLSEATDLVALPTPATSGAQLFLRDMVAKTNRWLSSRDGQQAGLSVSSAVMSTNGSVVAFLSSSLVDPMPKTRWLHLYSVSSNVLSEVPWPSGLQYNSGQSVEGFSLSADGRYLTYGLVDQIYRYDSHSGTTIMVSAAADGSPANKSSNYPEISDDGSVIIFSSAASNLAPGNKSDFFQLYRYHSSTETSGSLALLTPNVSRTADANRDILFPVLSADGTQAAFMSFATDITVEDDKSVTDVFLVPTSGTGSVQLLSTPLASNFSSTPPGTSGLPSDSLSGDGRFAVFTSLSADIVPGDDNDANDVFLRDLKLGRTRLVSTGDGVRPFHGNSSALNISRDGRSVAFVALNQTNPEAGFTVYVYNEARGTSVMGAILPDGTVAAATEARLSPDGNLLVFKKGNPILGIYVRDLRAEKTYFLKTTFWGDLTTIGAISPRGRYIHLNVQSGSMVFDWKAGSSVTIPNPTRGAYPVQFTDDESSILYYTNPASGTEPSLYISSIGGNVTNQVAMNVFSSAISGDGSTVAAWEQNNGIIELVIHDLKSRTASWLPFAFANGLPYRGSPAVSRDGRFVLFATKPFTAGGTNYSYNSIFIYDRVLTNLALVNHNLAGAPANSGANHPSFSFDGRTIAFESSASDLVADDKNLNTDVFLARVPVVDSDNDQLEDGWEIQHFGNLNAKADEDPDGDGVVNGQEFLSGTDPNDRTSAFVVRSSRIDSSGAFEILVQASPGRSYRLQYRAALGAGIWQDVGEVKTTFAQEISFFGTSPEPAGFYRVQNVE